MAGRVDIEEVQNRRLLRVRPVLSAGMNRRIRDAAQHCPLVELLDRLHASQSPDLYSLEKIPAEAGQILEGFLRYADLRKPT